MKTLRKTLTRHAPSLATTLRKIRAGEYELFPFRLVYAQPKLHPQIKLLLDDRKGFFFEVGANDGLLQSNTAYLEKYCGWQGILVEPLPTQFSRCVENRPASIVINAALVSNDFSGETVDIAYSNLMSIIDDPTHNLLSVENHVASGSRFLTMEEKDLSGHHFKVPAMTASGVLDRVKQARVDFFSLDVEGYELEVLKGIDFSRHRPRYFLIEARDKEAVDGLLIPKGYRCEAQWSTHDYLYQASD